MKRRMNRLTSLMLIVCMICSFIYVGSITAVAAPTCYQQGDSRWGGIYYGNWNLAESGCGIFSTVNAVNYLTGNYIPPTELAAWGYNNNYYNGAYGQGTVRATFYANVTAAFGSKYGFKVSNLTWSNIYNTTLKNHLINGGVVIVHVPNHFMAINAYDSSTAKFLVYDSAAAPKRNTSSLGSWLTADQINGNSLTKVDWFCLVTRTGSAPSTNTQTVYTTNAVVSSGSGNVHFGNNIKTAQVVPGTLVNYQVTPSAGYKATKILVGGTSVPIQNKGEDCVYQFTMPNGNCDVVVTFEKVIDETASGYYNTFDLTTSSQTAHNAKVTAAYTYTQGSTEVIPIRGWSVNTAGTRSFYYTVDGGATKTELSKEQRLDVLQYGSYSYYSNYCDSVNIGFSDTFNPSGLSVGTHTVDVYARDNSSASYAVGTITIEVKANTTALYTTNAIVESGSGTVHFGNNITTAQYVAGTVVNYQTTPAAGYKVSRILVGGTSIPVQNDGEDCVYQFTMPQGNCDVVVTFASSSSGGSTTNLYVTNAIVASGSGAVHFGNNITTAQYVAGTVVNYQTTPADGYRVSQILVGGTAVSVQNSGGDYVYQFTMPEGNCDVVVTFEKVEDETKSGYYNTFDLTTSSQTVHNTKATAAYTYTQGSTAVIEMRGWSVNTAGTKSFYYTVDGGATTTELNKEQRLDILLSNTYSSFANYCDSVNIGFDDTYNPSGLAVGTHTIDVYARDNAGASYAVGTITVTVVAADDNDGGDFSSGEVGENWEINNATNVTTGIVAGKSALVIRTGATAPSESVEAAYFETEYGTNNEKIYEVDFEIKNGTEFGVMGVTGKWQSNPGSRMFFATISDGNLRTTSGDDLYGNEDTGVDVTPGVVHTLKMVCYNSSANGTDFYFDGELVGHSNAAANPDRLIFRVGGANAEAKIYRVSKSIANDPSSDKQYRYYSETFDGVADIAALEAKTFGPADYPGGWTISELTNGHTVTIEKQDTRTNYLKMRRTGEGTNNGSLIYTMPTEDKAPADLNITFMYDGAGQNEFRFVDSTGDNWLCRMFIQDGKLYWGTSNENYTGDVLKDWVTPFTEHTLTLKVGDGAVRIFLDGEYLGEKLPFSRGFGSGLPAILKFYNLAKSITDATNAQEYLFAGLAIKSVVVEETRESLDDYREQLLQKGFPESYIPMLMELHIQHPNWKFNAHNVTQINNSGYTWDYVIEQMLSVPARNLMVKSDWAPEPFAALGDGNYAPYRNESLGTFDSGTFYAITEEATKYFIDPRNFLNEVECFMFLDWNYSERTITEEQIEKVLEGSVYANTVIPDLDGTTKYAGYVLAVCEEIGLHPLFVSSRLVQESGSGGPMVEGTTGDVLGNAELNGLYNFFNIGAGGDGLTAIYTNGMNEAKTGTPSMASQWGGSASWNTRWKAMYGGILKLRDNYVNAYKNTLYMQKFSTDPRVQYPFNGYMQNVCAPIFESRNMQKSVTGFGMLDNEFTFTIPVYDGMPDLPCADPGNGITRCSYSTAPVTTFVTPYVTAYDANGGYIPQVRQPIEVTYNIDHESTTLIDITGWSVNMDGVDGHFYVVDGDETRIPLTAVSRSDVLDVYDTYAPYCSVENVGYTGTFNPKDLTGGSHEICVYGINGDGETYKSAVLTINVKCTSGYYSYMYDCEDDVIHNGKIETQKIVNIKEQSKLTVRGWSVNTAGTKSFYYTIDGSTAENSLPAETRYDIITSDAYGAFVDYCDSSNIGFNGEIDASTLSPGKHIINVYAKDNSGASYEVASITLLITNGEVATITDKIDQTTFVTKVIGVESGCVAILALYKDNKLEDAITEAYVGTDITFITNAVYDTVKVFLWQDLVSATPLCESEIVK